MRWMPLLLLAACVTESNFGNTAANVGCDKFAECDPDAFDAIYGDADACETTLSEVLGGTCWQTHCETFDSKAANACISSYRDLECDEAAPSCNDVWEDCSELELLACFVTEGIDALF
jgi:hypothetical protein